MKTKSFLLAFILMIGVYTANGQVKAFVASCSSNEHLYTAGFTDLSMKLVNLTSEKFSIKDEVIKIKDYVYSDLSKELPFPLIPENTVLENQNFQTYVKEQNSRVIEALSLSIVPVEGYLKTIPLTKGGVTDVVNYFAADSANATLFIQVDFAIEGSTMIAGNGTAVARIKLTIYLRDGNNKSLMELQSRGVSKQTLKVVAGQITSGKDNIPEYLAEASNNLFDDMKTKMPKAIKKFEKKLKKYAK